MFPPINYQQVLVNLLPELMGLGITCEVVYLYGPNDLASDLEAKGIMVYCLNLHHRWAIWEGVLKLVTLLKREQYDIIHAHLFFSALYTALTRSFVPSLCRIVTFHNETFVGFPAKTLWHRIRKWLEGKYTNCWIDHKVAVSSAVAEHYSRNLHIPEIQVIHNAFPLSALNVNDELDISAVRSRFGVARKDFLIISPARLIAQKGHNLLIEAIHILRLKGLFPKVLIFGDGPLHQNLCQSVDELGLSEQITVRNAIPHHVLMEVVQASDLFAMPSLFEGFGLAPAEAMALERPVVASRVGGLMDLIEDGVSGVLVEPGLASKFAEAIELLMGDPQLRVRFGKAARQRISANFDCKIIAERYVNYYKSKLD